MTLLGVPFTFYLSLFDYYLSIFAKDKCSGFQQLEQISHHVIRQRSFNHQQELPTVIVQFVQVQARLFYGEAVTREKWVVEDFFAVAAASLVLTLTRP